MGESLYLFYGNPGFFAGFARERPGVQGFPAPGRNIARK